MFLKFIQYGYETFQNVVPILRYLICTEMYTALVTNKRLLEKESGCYKFIFPAETVTFLCNKILQLFQVNDYKFHKPGK